MGILARLFGDVGTVRVEGTTIGGETFTGKVQIESFNNSREELEEYLKDVVCVEYGKRVKELKITAFV
jgi:hypothetical protein